jgi:hypothetical protein
MKVIQTLQSEGVTVEVSLLDCGDRDEAKQLLNDCQRLAPLAGIFHLAMVLEDRLILNHVSARDFRMAPCLQCKENARCKQSLQFHAPCTALLCPASNAPAREPVGHLCVGIQHLVPLELPLYQGV